MRTLLASIICAAALFTAASAGGDKWIDGTVT